MKKAFVVTLALCMIFALVACAQTPAPTPTTPANEASGNEAGTSDELVIGFSWTHKNDTLFFGMADTLDYAVRQSMGDHGFNSVEWIHVVSGANAQRQADDIDDLIARNVDAIVVYAFDSVAIGSSIESARAAGIPIILYDRPADETVAQPDVFVGLDTVAQAYDAGVYFFQKMIDAGVQPNNIISIIGDLADQNALNRIEGFDRAAARFGLEVSVTVPSQWDSDVALANFTTAWQANPDSNAVLIASDFIITAVQSVLEANNAWVPMGEEGHVWICSQDGFPVGLQFIRDGYIAVSGVYNLEGMAELFANALWELLAGRSVEPFQTVGAALMTAENVDTQTWWAHAYE